MAKRYKSVSGLRLTAERIEQGVSSKDLMDQLDEVRKAKRQAQPAEYKRMLGFMASLLQDIKPENRYSWLEDFAIDAQHRAEELTAERSLRQKRKQQQAQYRETYMGEVCAKYMAMKRKRISQKKIVDQICKDHAGVISSDDIEIIKWVFDMEHQKAADMVFDRKYRD